jgi:hypothetical protein
MTKALQTDPIISDLQAYDSTDTAICFPFKIEPILPYAMHSPSLVEYVTQMERVLRKCLPHHLLSLLAFLPLITWTDPINAPDCFEIYFLCMDSKEEQMESIIIDMIKSWLIPGKSATILSTQSLNFQWDYFEDKTFFLLQAKVLLENGKDVTKVQETISTFSMQVRSSIKNRSYIQYFFQQRPLLSNMKSSEIHRELVHLIEKHPKLFDESIFMEMGRFFALTSDTFCAPRPYRLITKILTSHYLMRIHLLRQLSLYPEKRHIQVRYVRTSLNPY